MATYFTVRRYVLASPVLCFLIICLVCAFVSSMELFFTFLEALSTLSLICHNIILITYSIHP